MKVLLTARQPGGGIRTFFRYVCGHPAFNDVTFTLIAPDPNLKEFLGRFIPQDRMNVVHVDPTSGALYKKTKSLLSSNGFDLLHSHGFSAGVMSELARFPRSVRHLMTAHDVFRNEQFAGLKGKLKKHALGRVVGNIDHIHTVTEDARANLLEFLPAVKPAKVRTILHGVDTDFFEKGHAQDLHSHLNIEPGVKLIGFFGRFMAQKGFRTLVDAISILKEQARLPVMPLVLTFGWGGFIREDYSYIEQKGLTEHFRQMPATDQMPDMLKSVDFVVMPSRWEACGLLAMEALSAAVPIIGTTCIGLREVLEGTPARSVEPSDPNALASQIEQELSCPSKLEVKDYQPTAINRFDIARPAMELRRLYAEIVGHG